MFIVETLNHVQQESKKSPKWRNIIFDNNGKSHLGIILFNSQQEAEDRMKKIHNDHDQYIKDGYDDARIPVQGGHVLYSKYSWHMQMPVTK